MFVKLANLYYIITERNKLMKQKYLLIFLLIPLITGLESCVSTKNITYFNDLDGTRSIMTSPRIIPVIRKNDILGISVSSPNAEASQMFNQGSAGNTSLTEPQGGYHVTESGNILFPVLGSIKAEGFTIQQLTDTITGILTQRKLLVSPIVTINFLNFKVTVLGEVTHPTVLAVNNEKISILEAIGLAGDLTAYGQRTNILIIHDDPGKKTFARVDLTTKKIFESPDFYLRSNDVIYVEQNKNKLRQASNAKTLLPIVLSVISLLILGYSYYKR